jgi:hypothetical protein
MDETKEELQDDLFNRFTYHPPVDDQSEKYQSIRKMGLVMASLIAECCPDSRERSLAIAKVEEAVMWANSSIARHS